MQPGESRKHYVSYFQTQMALVYNCTVDVAAAAFISGLQVTHSYKNLVKHKVTKIKDILFWIQKYIQIEDTTRNASHSLSQTRERRGEAEATGCSPEEESELNFWRNQQTTPLESCESQRNGGKFYSVQDLR